MSTIREGQPGPRAIEGMRRHATVTALAPLAARDTETMLRSMFGDVQHLRRLAEVVAQRAQGNPGHSLDLIQHLVQQRLVTYVEGAWVLPSEITAEALPQSLDVWAARIERLTPEARALGRALSVRDGSIPFEVCEALAEVPVGQTLAGLEELVREGVLAGAADGYRFTRDAVRSALWAELDEARKRRVHRILGELLLHSAKGALERLEGGLHLLLGGDAERGTEVVARAAQHYGLVDLADVGQAAPALERALVVFEELGRPRHELLSLYAPLALAGYYAERKYADKYGEPALALLQELLGLDRARTLQRFMGQKLGLLVSLGSAALAFWRQRHNPRVPAFRKAMLLLFYCVSALTGVCAVCIDSQRARRYANVLEPLRALGRNHVATLMHDFCTNLSITVQDRIGLAQARWREMIARLEHGGGRIRDMTEDVRVLYLAGALYASGVIETWRDSSLALQYAERLEAFKLKLYELSANQIRMLYYAHQGNFALMEQHRERVEVHAIQRGTAWQAETWAFGALVGVYARVHDAIGVKHCMQQLQQLSERVPSLERVVGLAHGQYSLLRGSPEDAIRALSVGEEPLEHAGWARSRAALACAYNLLGQYRRAREICGEAERLLSARDFEYPAMTLTLQTELALADAGLGDCAAAVARLDALLRKHGPFEGPLTLSTLHEARLRVAATMQDAQAVEFHLACMQRWQRLTGIRSLIARGELIAKQARGAVGLELPDAGEREEPREHSQPLTVVHRLRHGGPSTLEGGAQWILDQLARFADVRAAHVFLWHDDRLTCLASHGELPDPSVFEMWLLERLFSELEEATVRIGSTDAVPDADVFVTHDRSYRMLRLITGASTGAQLAGVLVVSDDIGVVIAPTVLRVIAERLLDSRAMSSTVTIGRKSS